MFEMFGPEITLAAFQWVDDELDALPDDAPFAAWWAAARVDLVSQLPDEVTHGRIPRSVPENVKGELSRFVLLEELFYELTNGPPGGQEAVSGDQVLGILPPLEGGWHGDAIRARDVLRWSREWKRTMDSELGGMIAGVQRLTGATDVEVTPGVRMRINPEHLAEREAGAGPNLARAAALDLVNGHAAVVAEGVAMDVGPLTPDGAAAYVLVTEDQLAWALINHPDAAAEMRFDQIVRFGIQAEVGRLELTERDPGYAASLQDPTNPFGETDASLMFPDPSLLEAITHRIDLINRARTRSIQVRFAMLDGKPVATWDRCPVCESRITVRVEHGVMCSACLRCYTDPNFQPVPSDAANSYGTLSGTEPWRPLLETQIAYRDRTLVWVARPPGQVIGPPFIMESELLDQLG
jgi:hypothetical protein